MIYFTSDLHFSHFNIIGYCNRPYANAAEMNEGLIDSWNKVVQPDDIIYILGDVFFCSAGKAINILSRLNGKKNLIYGNHDKMIRKDPSVQKMFNNILPDLYSESIDGIYVVMCHYPLLSWERASRGSFNLHGHSHNNIPFDPKYRRMDVGVDAQGYAPISFQDIRKKLEAIKPNDVRN